MFYLNLIENYKADLIEAYETLEELIEFQVKHGWEANPDQLTNAMLTVSDGENGPIIMTLNWIAVEDQEWADLVIVRLLEGKFERYRRVEAEPCYTSQRIA